MRFDVVERASYYEIVDTWTGKSRVMGDGVDSVFTASGRPISPGTERFTRAWRKAVNENPDETLEAYFS